MSKQRRVRGEFWVIGFIVIIVAWALLADWWKENSTLGWIIFGVLAVSFGFVLYRSPTVRSWVGRTVKVATEKAVFDDNVASDREPIPQEKRKEVLERARRRCENEDCNQSAHPHIHHIDMNNKNNSLNNLIALCPNCHQRAHSGEFTQSTLRNWVTRDYQKLRRERPSSKPG